MVSKNEFLKRKEQLIKIIEEYPNSLEFIALAKLYLEMGEYENALQTILDGLKNHQDCADALFLAGSIYRKRGELEKAEEYITKCLKVDNYNIDAMLEYGKILIDYERSQKEILRYYRNLMELYPDNEEIIKTIQVYEHSSSEDIKTEESEMPTLSLIKLYWSQGFLKKAKELCKSFLENNPKNETAKEIYIVIVNQIELQRKKDGELTFQIPQPIEISDTESVGDFYFKEFEIKPDLDTIKITSENIILKNYKMRDYIDINEYKINSFGIYSKLYEDKKAEIGDYEIIFSSSPPFSKLSEKSEFSEFKLEKEIKDEKEIDVIFTSSLSFRRKTIEELEYDEIDLEYEDSEEMVKTKELNKREDDNSFQDWLDELIED